MLLIAIACAVFSIPAFCAKRPAEQPQSSRLYRVDNRVVGTILAILAVAFAVLAYTTGKPLF